MIQLTLKGIPLNIATLYNGQGLEVEIQRVLCQQRLSVDPDDVTIEVLSNGRAIAIDSTYEVSEKLGSEHRLLHVADLSPHVLESSGFRREKAFWLDIRRQLAEARGRSKTQKAKGDVYRVGDEWVLLQVPHHSGDGWVGLIKWGPRAGKRELFPDEKLDNFVYTQSLAYWVGAYCKWTNQNIWELSPKKLQALAI